jgi:deazaflavin-dependent oxidoreductase (nitroreductase family)
MSTMETFNSDPRAFNRALAEEYRANGGKVSSMPPGAQLLLLTTTGARSGQAHTVPLGYRRDGERLIVIASNNGAPKPPAWYHNLVADPEATVEDGTERYQARAATAVGAERERLVELLAREMPFFADHERKAGREIPIVVLGRSS